MRPEPLRNEETVSTSCSVCRPERNVYLLTPVIASEAAGPEINRIRFCAASGATCSETPDETLPAMIF